MKLKPGNKVENLPNGLRQQAMQLKKEMTTRRKQPKATITELMLLISCKYHENYSPMQKTTLYNLHSAEYCEYLQLLA